MQDFKWYVLRVLGGKEKKIKLLIENDLKRNQVEHLVNQIVVPLEKFFYLRKGKKILKERNFYPGYILIEADLNGEVDYVITSVNGVINFLGAKDQPEPMRDSEIRRILSRLDEANSEDENVEIPYMLGEEVRVIDGPFNTFFGIIDEINEEKKKLKIIVKIFGRKTPVELNYSQVEKK